MTTRRFRARPVAVVFEAVGRLDGQIRDRHVQVLDGVFDGELVVLYPGDSLAAGIRVVAR